MLIYVISRADFSEIFPGAPPEAIDFLEKSLQFNPKRRIHIDEAINHPLV
jgi:mitogen-activated protein kinase 1/3